MASSRVASFFHEMTIITAISLFQSCKLITAAIFLLADDKLSFYADLVPSGKML
jgi:hypothetical protein